MPITETITQKIIEEEQVLKNDIRKQVLTYITAAFGLVAGLAWNEAIQAGIAALIPLGKDKLAAKFLYAVVVTLILVIVTHLLTRVSKKRDHQNQNN